MKVLARKNAEKRCLAYEIYKNILYSYIYFKKRALSDMKVLARKNAEKRELSE